MAHRNETIARKAFQALREGDKDEAAKFFADDLEYHVGGNIQVGTLKGIESVIDLREEYPDMKPSFELHDVLANDEHVIILMWVHHRREGKKPLDAPAVLVGHMSDDKITEIWSFPWNPDAVREFLS